MPNIKSAEKRMRQSRQRRARNRHFRGRMRSSIKRFRQLLESEQVEEARQMLPSVYSAIDRSAQKGAIHPNTAARYKSRLTKHLSEAVS